MEKYELVVCDLDGNELYRNFFKSLDRAVRNAMCFELRYCVLSLTDICSAKCYPVYELIEVFR